MYGYHQSKKKKSRGAWCASLTQREAGGKARKRARVEGSPCNEIRNINTTQAADHGFQIRLLKNCLSVPLRSYMGQVSMSRRLFRRPALSPYPFCPPSKKKRPRLPVSAPCPVSSSLPPRSLQKTRPQAPPSHFPSSFSLSPFSPFGLQRPTYLPESRGRARCLQMRLVPASPRRRSPRAL